MAPPAPIRPSIALAAFAEKFIEGRRVLVFGNALCPFWEQLIERGARLVHVCDLDASRVAEAAAHNTSQNVSFAPLGGMGLAVRDGAFDVGFIDNLTGFSDPAQAIHKLKRALSPRGIALVSAPNPDVEQPLVGAALEAERPIDYYSLYDLVHREFPVVRMAGQMPFVGYTVAELAPAEEPEPCFDAGFVPGGTEEPEWFVAVASLAEIEIESFLVVQLPHELLLKNGSERLLREQLRAARSAERGAVERLSRLEAEQRKLVEVAERHQKDVDLARQVRLLQEELERKESWILQLEARAATADARADHADQELDALYDKIGLPQDGNTKLTPIVLPNLSELQTEGQALREKLAAAERHQQAQRQLLLAAESNQQQVETRFAEAHEHVTATQTQLAEVQAQLFDVRAQKQALETAQAALKAKVVAAESKQTKTQAELDELVEKHGKLVAKPAETDPELELELVRLEAQLVERSKVVLELEDKLAKTERVGAQLLRELERARHLAYQATNATATVESTTASPDGILSPQESAAVVTASTEAWTHGPTVSAAATTEQSVAQVSTWAESASTPSAELEELRNKLDRLAALAARQQADLGASQWRLEQIHAENQALQEQVTEQERLTAELTAVRARLQETEVLLAQLRWRQATTSDDGPMR
jgi:SAM-dependent methyltransferase